MVRCYCESCGEYMGDSDVASGTCITCERKEMAEMIRKYNLKVVDMVMEAANLPRREA